jgi:hypothetical protein
MPLITPEILSGGPLYPLGGWDTGDPPDLP